MFVIFVTHFWRLVVSELQERTGSFYAKIAIKRHSTQKNKEGLA
jgi:hypothetical protein